MKLTLKEKQFRQLVRTARNAAQHILDGKSCKRNDKLAEVIANARAALLSLSL